ncbi:hypothetical protein QBC34DRAFT_293246 [Podospora aff. communis PSN243]|uniref:Fucose-specific lectin n=1 Tax=Podospora aff. communis PSN243 TaxID=3040156 RepID=A0AAV9GVF8_9PEZI|nr:hypothetical protein QBC34DRAFT_293246 [Podospora aff. communis PSN243]
MSSLYFIKTVKADSNKVEVHIASPTDGYSKPAGHHVSGYSLADRNNGDFVVGPEGLYFVKTRNAQSGKIEAHRTTAASGYRDFDIHAVTVFELRDTDNGTWTFDNGNLYLVKTQRCESGLIELHRANGGSFNAFSLHAAVPIPVSEAGNGEWDVFGDELYFVKYRNTQGGNVEVWKVSGSGLQTVTRWTTWFNTADGVQGSWRIGKGGDLYFIKTKNTGSGKAEVHVASARSGYQQVSHNATWISQDDGPLGTWVVA